jgi:hypothetical protein
VVLVTTGGSEVIGLGAGVRRRITSVALLVRDRGCGILFIYLFRYTIAYQVTCIYGPHKYQPCCIGDGSTEKVVCYLSVEQRQQRQTGTDLMGESWGWGVQAWLKQHVEQS